MPTRNTCYLHSSSPILHTCFSIYFVLDSHLTCSLTHFRCLLFIPLWYILCNFKMSSPANALQLNYNRRKWNNSEYDVYIHLFYCCAQFFLQGTRNGLKALYYPLLWLYQNLWCGLIWNAAYSVSSKRKILQNGEGSERPTKCSKGWSIFSFKERLKLLGFITEKKYYYRAIRKVYTIMNGATRHF